MIGPVLPPNISLKREYNFAWYLDGSTISDLVKSSNAMKDLVTFRTLFSGPLPMYVSQMAETVNLPEDGIETEPVDVGLVSIPVPKKKSLGDISVTYLEDSVNTVYNFHKAWFECHRNSTTMSFYPLKLFSVTARYVSVDKSLSEEDYTVLANSLVKFATGGTLSSVISVKPTGITSYPSVFPIKISRTPSNKGGGGIAKVTVTYARIPNIKNYKPLELIR